MKVVIAMDSFKGSMTSLEAGNAAKRGILRSRPNTEVTVMPLADGGEGTVDALIEGICGNRIKIEVSDPLGRKTLCTYGVLPDGTAVMEMAQAAGLTKLTENERNPLVTSTYGLGEMIVDAMRRGCRKFIIGIGGSATNDGGIGMLSALGYTFLDAKGNSVDTGAQALSTIVSIEMKKVLSELQECEFHIACDVDNPLCGEQGATYVYGPQKGLPLELCQSVDEGMKHYSQVVDDFLSRERENNSKPYNHGSRVAKQYNEYPGAGAAGGLGFAFLAFLNARLMSGVDLILETIGMKQELAKAQIVITGEGQLDYQTAMGKAPIGLAKCAKQYGCKVLAFAGRIGTGAEACLREGLDAYFSISENMSLEAAMKKENAIRNMEMVVEREFDRYITQQNA